MPRPFLSHSLSCLQVMEHHQSTCQCSKVLGSAAGGLISKMKELNPSSGNCKKIHNGMLTRSGRGLNFSSGNISPKG